MTRVESIELCLLCKQVSSALESTELSVIGLKKLSFQNFELEIEVSFSVQPVTVDAIVFRHL